MIRMSTLPATGAGFDPEPAPFGMDQTHCR